MMPPTIPSTSIIPSISVETTYTSSDEIASLLGNFRSSHTIPSDGIFSLDGAVALVYSICTYVACGIYYLSLALALFGFLLIVKCIIGYFVLHFALGRQRSMHVRSKTFPKPSLNTIPSGIATAEASSSTSSSSTTASGKRPPLFSKVSTLSRPANSEPSSPANYQLLPKEMTSHPKSPLVKENSDVMLAGMYGDASVDSKATNAALRTTDVYHMENVDEERLKSDEDELIGTIKMPHPSGKLSLENIDRYTLFKSRIP